MQSVDSAITNCLEIKQKEFCCRNSSLKIYSSFVGTDGLMQCLADQGETHNTEFYLSLTDTACRREEQSKSLFANLVNVTKK